ncbi:MAG: hypothetical protein JXQ90_03110 [Cyclobacteriaceae bacterium]
MTVHFNANGQERNFEMDTSFLFSDVASDTTIFESITDLDPNRAAMLSAVLPGLGQVYNGQAWKVPIIYSIAITLGHQVKKNNDYFHAFRQSLLAEIDNNPNTVNQFNEAIPNRFNQNSLKRNMDLFRRNRDYMVIMCGVLYLINIAEAHIAAHLREFDLNDSLSLEIGPSIHSSPLISRSTTVSVKIRF